MIGEQNRTVSPLVVHTTSAFPKQPLDREVPGLFLLALTGARWLLNCGGWHRDRVEPEVSHHRQAAVLNREAAGEYAVRKRTK